MSFKTKQYYRTENLIKSSNIFYGDIGDGIFRKKSYPFVLNDSNNNLYLQSKADIINYFKNNGIEFWNGSLTNHTLSSQVACLNHLFPIREDKNAILSIMKCISPDIVDVLRITNDQYKPAYIQFEAVSDFDYLNEMTATRGCNCTSIDALIYGLCKDGRKILFPIEWKYVEVYNNENKANGKKGETRKKRYTDLIKKSLQIRKDNQKIYYFEPFYQLMRQTLWAEQMIAHKNVETIQADDYMHIHVIPAENKELLYKRYSCSGKEMEKTWRSCINDQSKYLIISPKDMFSALNREQYRSLLDYLEIRYW